MNEEFGHEPPDVDDFASMVAELRGRLDRPTLARALGVEPSKLDLIAAGYMPEPETAERLRLVYRLGQTTEDLRDPMALLAGLGVNASSEATLPFALMPRLKTFFIAFVVVDAVVFGGLAIAFVLLR